MLFGCWRWREIEFLVNGGELVNNHKKFGSVIEATLTATVMTSRMENWQVESVSFLLQEIV